MWRSSYATFITFLTCAAVVGGALWEETGREAEPSVGYAHVTGDGVLDTAYSKNVVAMGGGNGLYRFKLAFVPKNATATLANDPTAPNQGLGFISAAVSPTPTFTCATVPKPDLSSRPATRPPLAVESRPAVVPSTYIGPNRPRRFTGPSGALAEGFRCGQLPHFCGTPAAVFDRKLLRV